MDYVIVSCGSNKGNTYSNIRSMCRGLLSILHKPFRYSRLMKTAPVEVTEPHPEFLNIICSGYYTETPESLLRQCEEIERSIGRVAKGTRTPRCADIDILLYDDVVCNCSRLTLPHPGIYSRRYLHIGMNEIAAGIRIPGTNLRVTDLYTHANSAIRAQRVDFISHKELCLDHATGSTKSLFA